MTKKQLKELGIIVDTVEENRDECRCCEGDCVAGGQCTDGDCDGDCNST